MFLSYRKIGGISFMRFGSLSVTCSRTRKAPNLAGMVVVPWSAIGWAAAFGAAAVLSVHVGTAAAGMLH